MSIGEKLKQLRIQMDLTQEELANRCELSKGFISQVERDLNSPSIATLKDILECLGTSLKDFFDEEEIEKVVFSQDDVFVQENEELAHRIQWIVPNAQKNEMEPILITLSQNGRSNVYNAHEGEIFGYILTGNVNLCVGSKTYQVGENESFYYKANASHYLENTYDGDTTVIWISNPPNF